MKQCNEVVSFFHLLTSAHLTENILVNKLVIVQYTYYVQGLKSETKNPSSFTAVHVISNRQYDLNKCMNYIL